MSRHYLTLRRRQSTSVWWYMHAAVVVALVSVKLSTATYNPAYHPQISNWHPQSQHVQWEDPARGGSSTMMQYPAEDGMHQQHPPTAHTDEPYHPPKILLKHMDMALRLTSEWNRRLLNGVNRFNIWRRKQMPSQDANEPFYPSQQESSPNYGNIPVNVHPSRAWHPPIPLTSGKKDDDEELTLFHAKAPRELSEDEKHTVNRGVTRWGPELLPYLEHIVELLDISPDGVEIPLAMIYLDRACSVETPRRNGVPPCPFCIPRTVHRLSLASLLLAHQAVKGSSQEEIQRCYERVSSLGIPEVQLQQMVEWMRGALGDLGLMVTISQMQHWGHHWESVFHPTHPLDHSHPGALQPQKQQQLNYQDPPLEEGAAASAHQCHEQQDPPYHY